MKVAKKVRLLTKDAKGKLFVKSKNYQVLRERAVVEDSIIDEYEKSYPENGILYIVDEKATKEREAIKAKKLNPKKAVKEENTNKEEKQ